jgi:predicted GIY-YIG superfamily endonuclease
MGLWYVYRGTNHATREVYFGVSSDPTRRIDGSHCAGYTKTIGHWVCGVHDIRWHQLSAHRTQSTASARAHQHERTYNHRQRYYVFRTAGI